MKEHVSHDSHSCDFVSQPSSHTRNPVGSPCGSLSLSFDPGLMKVGGLAKGGLWAYHVSCECQSGLGLASPPVAQRLRRVS